MQFHFHANQSHFHKKGFALRLALKQRHKGTRKWPIDLIPSFFNIVPHVGLSLRAFNPKWDSYIKGIRMLVRNSEK